MTQNVEVTRVADHIRRAEVMAAQRDVSQLSRVQRLVRRLLLQALAAYRAGGRFPKNRDFRAKTPYFVDADGTRCAMAHLLELGGEGELVAKIARERNNAYVRELADEPRLLAWLEAAGLGVEEAAAIQPEYCELVTNCVCGGDFSFIEYPVPARGVVEGVVLASGKLRVDRTYGDALGITVGSELPMTRAFAPGATVVAPIDAANEPVVGIVLDAQGEYSCHSQGVASAPALDAESFAAAVLAADCAGELRAQSAGWHGTSCGDDPLPDDPDGGGCSASPASASVGILLALVAVLARRR